jgi:hypothetical protein
MSRFMTGFRQGCCCLWLACLPVLALALVAFVTVMTTRRDSHATSE